MQYPNGDQLWIMWVVVFMREGDGEGKGEGEKMRAYDIVINPDTGKDILQLFE